MNYRLIGGDFSGIQDYIYSIVSKYAARNLRGRSFYIRILSDSVVRQLRKDLGIGEDGIVYNSGGTFLLVAADAPEFQQKFDDCVSRIERAFFTAHSTGLYVAIANMSVDEAVINKGGRPLRDAISALYQKRNALKKRKFANLMDDSFFTPFNSGGEIGRDSISGEELTAGWKSDDELKVNVLNWQQIEIGNAIRKPYSMIVLDSQSDLPSDILGIRPAGLDFVYCFIPYESKAKYSDLISAAEHIEDCSHPVGGDTVIFEELCDKSSPFKRLGVLRMDVDNLGHLFQSGIPDADFSLSSYSEMSSAFDRFFTQELPRIRKSVVPDNTQVVYAGGDDLFIVGDWKYIIRMAEKIREEFGVFVSGLGYDATISGGIAILDEKYPIMSGASLSAEEEESAKEHCVNDIASKNSISFMDFPLNWSLEFPAVKALKDKLSGMILSGTIPSSFLHKLQTLSSLAGFEDHKVTHFNVFWMLSYDMSRFKSRNGSSDINAFIDGCIREICGNAPTLDGVPLNTSYHSLELWSFAARWAELESRIN